MSNSPPQPDNVDYRLVDAFEMLRHMNSKSPEKRVEFARTVLAPMIPNFHNRVTQRALSKAVNRVLANAPQRSGDGPRAA